MNWSPFQITFLLDGVAFYTYNPAIKDEATWPFDKEQYLLLNIAMGGFAGTISGSFSQTSMINNFRTTFELPANRTYFVAYLWPQTPFAETPMTLVSGRTFTATITGQIPRSYHQLFREICMCRRPGRNQIY